MNRRNFLVAAMVLLSACGRKHKKYARLPAGTKVLALGDSLTFGYGTKPDTAYPVLLAQATGWGVINGGISGDTSEKTLARLPALLNDNPQLVLISIGGNDFLRKVPTAETTRNIAEILKLVGSANAQAILIAEPHISAGALVGILSDSPIYAELAQQHKVPLLEKAWANILSDEKLKSDQIHANTAGYQIFTETLVAFLRKEGFI